MTILVCCMVAVFQLEDARPASFPYPTGVVVTADGAPVSGAAVVLQSGFAEDAPVLHAKTDAQGRFEFPQWRNEYGYWQLAAWKTGWAVAGFRPQNHASNEIPEVEIVLRQPSFLRINARLPEGGPASAARWRVDNLTISKSNVFLHAQSIQSLLSTEGFTSVDSNLNWIADGDVATLEVVCDELPSQMARVKHQGNVIIQLKPTGMLRGVIADPAGLTDGQRLQLAFRTSIRHEPREGNVAHAYGYAVVETNESGEFEGRFPAGSLTLAQVQPPDRPWYVETGFGIGTANQPEIKADQTTDVKLEIKPAVPVVGKLTGDADQPVAGARLVRFGQPIVTDANGEYRFWCRPGVEGMSWLSVPEPWLIPPGQFLSVNAGTKEQRVPTIKLERAAPISGRVIDENGDGVSGANVVATWQVRLPEGVIEISHDSAKSDAQGHYVLKRTSGDNRVTLTAATRDRASMDDYFVAPGSERQIDLTITRNGRMVATGRVVDYEGNPVAGARVAVWEWHESSRSSLQFDNNRFTVTDGNGHFRTPPKLLRRQIHHIVVTAPGFTRLETEETTSPRQGDWELGDVVLENATAIRGRVTDQQGEAVTGATVWSWSNQKGGLAGDRRTTCQTGENGEFLLEEIISGTFFFFVEHPDYRLTGGLVDGDKRITVQLDPRGSWPAAGPLHMLPRSEMARQQHVQDLATSLLSDSEDQTDDRWLGKVLTLLAAVDEAEAEARLDQVASARVRMAVLLNLGRIEEALEDVDQVRNRVAIARIVETIEAGDCDEHDIRLLQQAVEDIVERETDVQSRLRAACRLAIALRSQGYREQSGQIVRLQNLEPESAIDQAITRRFMAMAVAPMDAETALELLQPIEREVDRLSSFGPVVNEAAWEGPDQVRKFLDHCPDPENQCGFLTAAAARMARIDLPATLELIEQSSDRYRGLGRAKCYARIAAAINDSQPKKARELLAKAHEIIAHKNMRYHEAAAFRLLPFAHIIDPDSLNEYWWRAVAAQGGPYTSNPNISKDLEATVRQARLALLLALYNQFPELREGLMERVFDYWESKPGLNEEQYYYSRASVAAMTLHDPDRAIALAGKWWERNDLLYRIHPRSPAFLFGDILVLDGDELSEVIARDVFNDRD